VPGPRRIFLWSAALACAAGLAVGAMHLVRREVVARPEFTVRPEVTRVEAAPAWLDDAGLRELVRQVEAALGGPFQVFETGSILAAGRRLGELGLAAGYQAERILPSQVRLVLDLPRPIAWCKGPDGGALCLDLEGKPLPLPLDPLRLRLPELTGLAADPECRRREATAGAVVAWEVQGSFLPALEPGLALAAVDLSNLDYRLLADGTRGEVRIVLTGPGGNCVTLEWDRRPDGKFPPMPVERKIAVAREILARYPGFCGVLSADLRLENRWEQWLTLAPCPPSGG